MKTIATIVALAAVIAWPAVGDAASKKKKAQARPAVHHTVVHPRMQTGFVARGGRSPTPQWDVYRDNGEYAGTDPDPNVRLMLRKDDPNADP